MTRPRTRRWASLGALAVAVAASFATKGPPGPSVEAQLASVRGEVPADGAVVQSLTLLLPASVVDAGPTNLILMVSLYVPPAPWDPDTDDASDTEVRSVHLEIQGDDPSMRAIAEVIQGEAAFVQVGAPLDRCVAGSDCTFTFPSSCGLGGRSRCRIRGPST